MSMYRCDDLCLSNEDLALRIQDGDPQERGISDHAGRKLLRTVFSGLSGGRPQAGGCAGAAGRGAAV